MEHWRKNLLNTGSFVFILNVSAFACISERDFFFKLFKLELHKTALMTSDEAQPVTPGKMSHRQGKEGHPIQTKELLQPSALSPGVSCSIGKGGQFPIIMKYLLAQVKNN
ncbi:Oxysterol-binding protein-related protein 8 [Acipenser ruthenus]|uniref:Oxysterol-binding protein-related protein 8 n=1 Tax=Acipenser ruthenus TaxID=7906 RepID=A0A662YWM8_ACIRT|nr:Oxysterol-binding protein-related protein 8 [Acipenser ruthenus]